LLESLIEGDKRATDVPGGRSKIRPTLIVWSWHSQKKREEDATGQKQARDNPASNRGSGPFGGAMLWRWSKSASPLEFAVTKNASASPLECAPTKLLDLKPPEIISYKNMPGVPPWFAALLTGNSRPI